MFYTNSSQSKRTVTVTLNVRLMLWSPHPLNAKNLFCCFCVGCQADNGCIKKGSEVSAQGCIKYICNKKGDLEILSVGKQNLNLYITKENIFPRIATLSGFRIFFGCYNQNTFLKDITPWFSNLKVANSTECVKLWMKLGNLPLINVQTMCVSATLLMMERL